MSDFEVRVKQSQSGDAVKQTLNDLKTIKSQAADTTKSAGDGFESMGRKISGTQNMAQGLIRTLKGDIGGLMQMAQGVRGLWAGLGPAVAVVGAAIAGWKIGEKAREFIELKTVTSQVGEEFEGLGSRASRSRKEIATLAAQKLTDLQNEIKKTIAELEDLSKFGDEEARRSSQIADARHRERVARIEATMEPGTARDRALAEENASYESTKAEGEITQAQKTIKNATQQKQAYEAKYNSAAAEVSSARTAEEAAKARVKPGVGDEVIKRASDAAARTRAAESNFEAIKAMGPEIYKAANREIYNAEAQQAVAASEKSASGFTRQAAMRAADRSDAESEATQAAKDMVAENKALTKALRENAEQIRQMAQEQAVLKQQAKAASRRG